MKMILVTFACALSLWSVSYLLGMQVTNNGFFLDWWWGLASFIFLILGCASLVIVPDRINSKRC